MATSANPLSSLNPDNAYYLSTVIFCSYFFVYIILTHTFMFITVTACWNRQNRDIFIIYYTNERNIKSST